jgi:hypothetical protein
MVKPHCGQASANFNRTNTGLRGFISDKKREVAAEWKDH